jgi:hypothetical protein
VNKIIKINRDAAFRSLAASVIIHAAIFFSAFFLLKGFSADNMARSMYIQVSTGAFTPEKEVITEDESTEPDAPVNEIPEQAAEPAEKNVSYFYTERDADTTGLNNVYSEPTLNVKIKYPAGWSFIDQNVKNRLDGVTFWGLANVYNPPPYIHLEVKEKYLFNPSRYKYSAEYDDYTIFYNDPEEMSDQFTQIIYIRTRDDEDYSLKLIMKGEESFKTFQPVFFGMLKTFRFGN